jgi:hypothetical protein
MSAVVLLVIASGVMFVLSMVLGWAAYREPRRTPMAIFVLLAILAFVLSACAFGVALERVDETEDGRKIELNIGKPF